MINFPRASACGLSPGLGSAGPLGRYVSIPAIAFVVLDIVGLEECPELVLERSHPVMLTLVANVGLNLIDLGPAHREGAIACLPEKFAESRVLLAKPVVRAFLEIADDFAQGGVP